MSSFKTMFFVAVLAAIAGGVYISLQRNPASQPGADDAFGSFSDCWSQSPSVQLGPQAADAGSGQTAPQSWGSAAPASGSELGGMTPPFDASQLAAGLQGATGQQGGSLQLPTGPPPQSGNTDTGSAAGVPAAASQSAAPIAQSPGAETPDAQFSALLRAAREKISSGRYVEALQELSQYYDKPNLTEAQRTELVDLLDRLAYKVIYSREHMLEPPYTVRPGDTLPEIARNYNVPWQLLAKINGIEDPEHLTAGQQLKVIRGQFDAEINLDRHELTLRLRGLYAGRFRIGVSPLVLDRLGNFFVEDKSSEASDPKHYWIKLADQLAIHAASHPDEIGTDRANGSICVEPEQIENLHAILSIGSRIRIVKSSSAEFTVGSQAKAVR